MNVKLIFNLQFFSDYHIASDKKLCSVIDSGILKNTKGDLIVKGSTLKGLFKTSISLLLKEHKEREEKIINMFGNHEKGGQWLFSSASLKNVGQKKNTQVRFGVRIDPKLRKAADNKLFSREYGNGKSVFEFSIENTNANENLKDEIAIIVAASRLIRGIGSAVNRGNGKCLIKLVRVEGVGGSLKQDELLLHFKDFFLNRIRNNKIKIEERINENNNINLPLSKMLIIGKSIEPLIIADKSHSGNEFLSIDHIPGTAILGAFAKKYIQHYDIEGESYNTFLNFFKYGDIKFTPLYIAKAFNKYQLNISIPMPFDMLSCKNEPFNVQTDHLELEGYAVKDEIPESCTKCKEANRISPLKNGFGYISMELGGSSYELNEPKTVVQHHVAMHPQERRANEGDLYVYKALAEEQYFTGEISFVNEVASEKVLNMCKKIDENYELELSIGKGITRGYGKMKFLLVPIKSSHLNPIPLEERIEEVDKITLTFLSDSILLDEWGRTMIEFTSSTLSKLLDLKVEVINSFVSTTTVKGFNSMIGLPKTEELSIKAGSAVGFKVIEEVNKEDILNKLEKLEDRGIGIRKNEGFGIIAFNHAIYQLKRIESVPIEYKFSGNVPWYRNNNEEKTPLQKMHSTILEKYNEDYFHENINNSIFIKNNLEIAKWLYENSYLDYETLNEKIKNINTFNKINNCSIKLREKTTIYEIKEILTKEMADLKSLYDDAKKDSLDKEGEYEDLDKLWRLCIFQYCEKLIAYGGVSNE